MSMKKRLRYRKLTPETYAGKLAKKTCHLCEKIYWCPMWKKDTAKYCSFECAQIGRSSSTSAQRGDKLRGRGEGKTKYTKRQGMHEHRFVAEQMIGRKLVAGEVVHHKNGDSKDNRPENLEVLKSQSDHIEKHRKDLLDSRGLKTKKGGEGG